MHVKSSGVHAVQLQALSSEREAAQLFYLLSNKLVLHEVGQRPPPITVETDVIKHNTAVARHLQKLQTARNPQNKSPLLSSPNP